MKLLLICSLALGLAAPVVSFAADKGPPNVPVKVRYNDLNLSQPKDAAVLLRRVDSAATEACGGWISYNPIDLAIARTSECHDLAMKQAVARINAPMVSALYNGTAVALATNDK